MFPLANFGDPNDSLNVPGSEALINAFNSINDKKLDLLKRISEIELVGFNDKEEVILRLEDDVVAAGCYNFTYEFFEELFDMGKYAKFCVKNDLQDLVKMNFTELSSKIKDEIRQYRLISSGDHYLLRGLTSDRYNNYDNHLSLYLTFLGLHKYAKDKDIVFNVESADITDSAITVFFEQTEPMLIPDVGKVYFGAVLSNGEIRDRMFTLESRYRVADIDDASKSFAGILKDSVFTINHTTKLDNLPSRLAKIFKIGDLQETMLDYISQLKSNRKLSADTLYKLMDTITNNRNDFTSETRKNLRDLYDNNLVNNTLTILQLFDKVKDIVTDVDERICLERIYHELLFALVQATN